MIKDGNTLTGEEIMTNEQIAMSWDLWREYIDTNGEMTREEFDSLSVSEKTQIINDCFPTED